MVSFVRVAITAFYIEFTYPVVSTVLGIQKSLIKMPNARLSLSPVFKIAMPSPTHDGQHPSPPSAGFWLLTCSMCLGPAFRVHAPPGRN